MSETSQWYAVRCAGGRECRVAAGLAERELLVFLPMLTRWSTPGHRQWQQPVPVKEPLIPGYLFVLCQVADFDVIHAIDEVSFVRCMGEDGCLRPIAFPVEVVLGLQADERCGVYDRTRAVKVKYRPKAGAKVRVTAGTWLGFIGRVISAPKGERLHLMIEGPFGGGRTVSLDSVEPA